MSERHSFSKTMPTVSLAVTGYTDGQHRPSFAVAGSSLTLKNIGSARLRTALTRAVVTDDKMLRCGFKHIPEAAKPVWYQETVP